MAFLAAANERIVGDLQGEEEPGSDREDVVAAAAEEEEADDFVIYKRVPLSCGAGKKSIAKCGGCRKPVKERDSTAVQCDLRNGWWHLNCCAELVGSVMYPRAVLPKPGDDVAWICPQCSMHLCRNDDRTRYLCVACQQPSTRSGFGEMGGDMVQCDSDCNGLF